MTDAHNPSSMPHDLGGLPHAPVQRLPSRTGLARGVGLAHSFHQHQPQGLAYLLAGAS